MQQKNFSYKYSRAFLHGLSLLYFVIPLGFQYFTESNFYTYSSAQLNIAHVSIISFILISIFIETVFSGSLNTQGVRIAKFFAKEKKFIFLNYILMIPIIYSGLQLRLAGAGRVELVEAIHSVAIPGYGLILFLSALSIALNSNVKYLIFFIVFSVTIDLIYMGKIYSFLSLAVFFFYLDNRKIDFSFLRLMQIFGLGILFLAVVFTVRSDATDGFMNILAVYSFVSEFVGVNSTIGWAWEYNTFGLPSQYLDFGKILENHYISNVGHGLALAFPAYFVGNFGDYWLMSQLSFLLVTLLIVFHLKKIFGNIAVFLIIFNGQHLLRHGPDIFLEKLMLYSLGILFVILFFRLIKTATASNNATSSLY